MSGSDFPEVSEMIMFNGTVTSGTVAITPSNDTVLENDEMFTLSLATDDQFLDVNSMTTITITDTTGETKDPIAAESHLLLLSLSLSGQCHIQRGLPHCH